jgi:hypothetical protein
MAVDFLLIYIGQDWLRSNELWGSLGLDYHYGLGIKDTLIALILFRLQANSIILASYLFASLLCWSVWSSYALLEYAKFITFYEAWSPLYFLAMIGQVTGLLAGDRDAGIHRRTRRVSDHRDRIFRAGNRVAGAYVAKTGSAADRKRGRA